MARCSPLGETTASVVGAENVDRATIAAELKRAFGENPATSNGERCPTGPNARDALGEGGSSSENSWTCYFGSSTITVGKINEMVEKGYFSEGEARAPGAEIVLELDNDKAVVYEDFFYRWLAHASPCDPSRHSAALPDTTASVNTQCHRTIVEIFLGGG
jgi:hypothetical protein